MSYDYSKLTGRIIEVCGSQANFAKEMRLSERSISLKLNNKIPWKQPEIQRASEVLKFSEREIQTYFFVKNVQFN